MIRPLLAVSSFAVLSACAPRYDVNVSWTLDGVDAKDACGELTAPSVRFRVDQQDSQTGPVIEETETATCAAGSAAIKSAAYSTLFVDLLSNTDVYGTAGPLALAPGAQPGDYAGQNEGSPVLADIQLSRGVLKAHLTVGGKECGDAGATDFDVTLRDNSSPLGEDAVQTGAKVSCTGGVALYTFQPIDNGSRYDVVATTTINGQQYATSSDGIGAGAVASGAVTNLVVDLEPVSP